MFTAKDSLWTKHRTTANKSYYLLKMLSEWVARCAFRKHVRDH